MLIQHEEQETWSYHVTKDQAHHSDEVSCDVSTVCANWILKVHDTGYAPFKETFHHKWNKVPIEQEIAPRLEVNFPDAPLKALFIWSSELLFADIVHIAHQILPLKVPIQCIV